MGSSRISLRVGEECVMHAVESLQELVGVRIRDMRILLLLS